MPEIKYYRVTQTREVRVAANNIIDAARIADAAFEHGQSSDNSVKAGKGPENVWGNTRSRIDVTDLSTMEE